MYQSKLQEEPVQDVININKMKFEPYGDLVDQAFVQFNENLITIKTHIVKLKMMKHQRANTPMKVIQKKEEQTKLLHFPILCQKYYQAMKLRKV